MVRAVSWSWFRGADCSAITLLFENIGWRFSCLFLAVRFSGGEAANVREVARTWWFHVFQLTCVAPGGSRLPLT